MELNDLKMKRIAAWAINHLLSHYELGSMAEKFNGDDDNWAVDVPISATATRSGRLIAKVEFEGPQLTIYIPDAYQIIRGGHIRDFRPEDHGIQIKTVELFTGGTEDDIVAELAFDEDLIPALDGPRRMVPKSPVNRKFRIKGQLKR